MRDKIAIVLVVLGYMAMAIATVSGFGYALYNLGSVGLEAGVSAWMGFVLFTKLFGGGVVTLIAGLMIQS